MNRIDKKLTSLKAQGRKMLSPYVTAGDPSPEQMVALMHALVDAGADIIELGIPFSDPMAEGPVIQAAMERALQHRIDIDAVLQMVVEFRQEDKETPVILMGYLNPVEQYGYERFARQAKQSGVDGTILVDLPPEEATRVHELWQQSDLASIFLCSPTTSAERMALINQYAKGYLYYVSIKGVTGSDAFAMDAVRSQYKARKAETSLPLMLGFGIKNPIMAAEVAEFADGVIVGAALIETMVKAQSQQQDPVTAAAQFLAGLRQAMDLTGKTL